jgi:hypothetical protein
VGKEWSRVAPISGGIEHSKERIRRILFLEEARYDKVRKVVSWIVAAGQVDMRVVLIAEKPKPLTIWLENWIL